MDNLLCQKTNLIKSGNAQNKINIEEIIASIDDNTKLLRLPAVEDIVGFKTTEIYKRIKAGTFPAPIKLGRRQAVWLSTQITEWKKRIVESAQIFVYQAGSLSWKRMAN